MIALVFPGQGSQSVGMLADLADAFPLVQETFDAVGQATEMPLWNLVCDGPEEALSQTCTTQPALLAAGVATWRVWLEVGGPRPTLLAGHSLGEYAALVASEALTLEDAARLVRIRADAMQRAVPAGTGAMAAILKLGDDVIETVCAEVAGAVAPANYNSPGQVVIAGTREAVDEAVVRLKAEGGRAIPVNMSVPSHCELMRPASEELERALAEVQFTEPRIPVLHNVDVRAYREPEDIRRALRDQLHQPVRWASTIKAFGEQGISHIGECGPGKVLTGLAKRIDRGLNAQALGTLEALRGAAEAWGEES